ncbi:MAG TPA: type II secretion system protein [Candidatus Saccharimonadales bacterium]|nr:type II secretion system protein [Candidatus Saccharimonadales bacterium]
MTLNNIKTKQRGFTIVELLIVIVVIGILAAITIVAYNGVQNRARTTEAQANAKEVQNKAEVYAADTGDGLYPATAAAFIAVNNPDTAALSPKVDALIQTAAPTSTTTTRIGYAPCPAAPASPTGAKISYWDYAAATPAPVYINAGSATGDTATC